MTETIKIYSPSPRVVYVIYYSSKNKKKLYSACGNISEIKEYCKRYSIDYEECEDNEISETHYLERK